MDKGGRKVYEELKKDNVIVDLQTLVDSAKNMDDTISSYVEFMKERIMGVSCNN